MSNLTNLYQGAVAPETYAVGLVPGDSGLDLSTVSDAKFEVLKPDGTIVEWAGSLSNQTATTLTVTYSLAASPSDLADSGIYKFFVKVTVPGGFLTSERWDDYIPSIFEVPS